MPRVTSMPPTAYNRTISTIRDYPRMVMELEQLTRETGSIKAANYDGMPKGASGGSGIENEIAYLVDLEREVQKIQAVIDTIPADMRDGIMNNILYNMGFPRNEYGHAVPSLRQWQREKNKFVLRFAHEMRIYGKYQR